LSRNQQTSELLWKQNHKFTLHWFNANFNYLFQLLLISQIESYVEQRQEGVDELKERHLSYQVIIVL
jgi:hypothetical protein